MKQKTIEPRFFVKVGAAAFALALPLCAGCVKKDTTPPASQPSGYTEMKREPKGKTDSTESVVARALTELGSRQDKIYAVDIAVADAYKKAAMSQPASAPKRMATATAIDSIMWFPRRDAIDRRTAELMRKFGEKEFVEALVVPFSQPAASPKGPVTCRDLKRVKGVGPGFKQTFSLEINHALAIKGHESLFKIKVLAVTKKGVKLMDLVNERTVTIGYGNEIKFRDKGGNVYVKVERGKGEGVANISIAKLEQTCKHPITPSFDIYCYRHYELEKPFESRTEDDHAKVKQMLRRITR